MKRFAAALVLSSSFAAFTVTDGIRPKTATLDESAAKVVDQVRALPASGVPASRIAVVGGSMGAAIALRASLRLQNPAVSFSVLERALPAVERRRALARHAQRARDRARDWAAPRFPVPAAPRVGRAGRGVVDASLT
jgi:alpha-beta hydrolase superfamily lysophospholipase